MEITVNSVRENDEDKTVFFTLVDDDEVEYKGSTDIPLATEDEQAYCETNIRRYMLFYRKKEYPKSKQDGYGHYLDNTENELAAIEEWIEDGCMLRDSKTGAFTGNVDKVPWKGIHPPKTKLLDREQISEATWQQYRDAMAFEEAAKANNNGQMIEVLFAHIRVLQDIIFGRD